MFLELGDEYGFEADSSSDVRCFADSVLQRYDIVAFANASYVDFDSGQREAFRNFIRRGGGFVGVHAAACTGNKWAWFTRMIGGCFDRHPPLQPFVVRTTEAGRKRGTALPDSLTVNDECYLFRLTNPDRNILAVCETRTIDLTPTEEADSLPERVPVVWSLDFEGGRIWYTALGHRPEDYAQPWYRRHILEGLRSVVR